MAFQKYISLLILSCWLAPSLTAQPMIPLETFAQAPDTTTTKEEAGEIPEADHAYRPLHLRLDHDGSKYVRFIMWHQVWATTNNLDVEGAKMQVQPSLRRSRFLAFAQVSPKFLILTHFGLNGLTPDNLTSLGSDGNAPQLFLHDAWVEFKLLDELYIGGGLHYWKAVKMMPYLAFQTSNYEGLEQRPNALNIGVHYFILGHHAKITLEYHQIANDPREGDARDVRQVRLQAQVFL